MPHSSGVILLCHVKRNEVDRIFFIYSVFFTCGDLKLSKRFLELMFDIFRISDIKRFGLFESFE